MEINSQLTRATAKRNATRGPAISIPLIVLVPKLPSLCPVICGKKTRYIAPRSLMVQEDL
jgi:hypothetical protein